MRTVRPTGVAPAIALPGGIPRPALLDSSLASRRRLIMFSRLHWLVLHLSRQMWLRATAFSVLGVASALAAILLKRYIPADLTTKIGANAVDSLLNVIASSMLAVTIFSLSTMVAAFASATSNVTPRATRLLSADSTAQNALATFLGSFLFSLVGIIGLHTGLYGDSGRVILYGVTLVVLALIIFTLLRWIDYVLKLGRVGPTSARVEEVASKAMRERWEQPLLGGVPVRDEAASLAADGQHIAARSIGYVEHIDMAALQDAAAAAAVEIVVYALPGDLAGPGRPLAMVSAGAPEGIARKIQDAFNVTPQRSFDQDPRFGLCVLSEIASRALSPAVNDPGTAIEILCRGARVLAQWAPPCSDPLQVTPDARYPRVQVPALQLDDLFEDFFVAIARDGAANIEVAIQLQKVLHMLASVGESRYLAAALLQSRAALARNEAAMSAPSDLARIRSAAARIALTAL